MGRPKARQARRLTATSMRDTDPGKLADELRREADELQRRSQALGEEVDGVRLDWQRKRSDAAVPGAPPEEDDRSQQASDSPEQTEDRSPAPESPPPGAGPKAQAAPEAASGPSRETPENEER